MFHKSWLDFKEEVYSRSRFYNERAQSFLNDIFDGIDQLRTTSNEPIIKDLPENEIFYRARIALNEDELYKILADQPEQIGPPAPQFANAGRMNAQGIGVFYGAFDKNVCIAEVRPPVGCHVVIGSFKPLRVLRLLDLPKLESVYPEGSLFDPDHVLNIKRVSFIKNLVEQVSMPVMPGEESKLYLPTQVISEYWHSRFNIDGVIFKSSQVDGEQRDLRNIVIFNRSCRVQPHTLPPNTKVEVTSYMGDPDDPDYSITIWESTDIAPEEEEKEPTFLDVWPDEESHKENGLEEREENLVQLIDKTEVYRINAVAYSTVERHTSRHRSERNSKLSPDF